MLPFLGLSLLIASSAVLGYRYVSDEIRRETHRTLAVIAEQKRQQVEDWINQARLDARLYFFSDNQLTAQLHAWLQGGRVDAALLSSMRTRLAELAEVRGWSGLSVHDRDGQRLFTLGRPDGDVDAERVREVLRKPGVVTLGLHAAADGQAQYALLTPIGTPGREPLAVAYLVWRSQDGLDALVESWPVPTRTAETYLVQRDGDGVRFLTPLRHHPEPALSLVRGLNTPDLPAARAAQGERGIIAGGRDYRGVPVLAYAAAVEGEPWLMIAEIDEREAYARILAAAWVTTFVVGLGLMLVYSAGHQLWRRDRQRRKLTLLQTQRAAEARFRVIFEQAPLGIALRDSRTGRIIEANQRFAEIVGRAPAALAGIDPISITHPEDVSASLSYTSRLQTGEISGYCMNKRYLRPSGRVVWTSLTCAPVQGEDELAPRFLAIVEDITERTQMEERLRISEMRHRLLADNAIDVIWTMTLDERFSYVSPSVEKLRGFRSEEVMRQSLEDMLAPESLRVARDYLHRLQTVPESDVSHRDFRGELEQRCRDGASVWTDVTMTPLWNSDGAMVEILGVTRDITERRLAERELQRASAAAEAANAAKSEFLAHMSHEIRTPLNAVLGLAQVLGREPLANHQRDMVERIHSAGRSLLAILDDVLDLSKIEAGQLRLEPRPFDLAGLFGNLESLMGPGAATKGLRLRIQAPEQGLEPLLGDGLRLEQVLLNLTSNAIKFTEAGAGGGEVSLSVAIIERDASRVRLRFEVRDTGIGISSEALGRLFAPFIQAEEGIGRRFGGTGLGLAICKRLVELMGGRIGADSRVGEGSLFWFELPFDLAKGNDQFLPASLSSAPLQPQGPIGRRLYGAHLLVVDDSAMSRDLMQRALATEGASATFAADGQQALEILRTGPAQFDAVLMDVQMPVMDGLTATTRIRAELGLARLPVIAFTAGVREDQRAAARAAGADAVLAKPLELEKMVLLLSQWIDPRGGGDDDPPGADARQRHPQRDAPKEPFPDIEGIDGERAAKRLGHDLDLFFGLLELFVRDYADAGELTRNEIALGDFAAAGRRLHTLRGNAGFLCASGIEESTAAIEEALERGAEDVGPALDELGQRICALVEASAPWRSAEAFVEQVRDDGPSGQA